ASTIIAPTRTAPATVILPPTNTQPPSATQPPPTVTRAVPNGMMVSGPAVVVSKQYGAALRAAPSSDAQVITILACGESLALLGEQSGWYHVTAAGSDGWIGGARTVHAGTPVDCSGARTYQVGDG